MRDEKGIRRPWSAPGAPLLTAPCPLPAHAGPRRVPVAGAPWRRDAAGLSTPTMATLILAWVVVAGTRLRPFSGRLPGVANANVAASRASLAGGPGTVKDGAMALHARRAGARIAAGGFEGRPGSPGMSYPTDLAGECQPLAGACGLSQGQPPVGNLA